MNARVVELAVDSRAVIDERRDVTIIRGGMALGLRRREFEKLIRAYQEKQP